ncbi:LysR family transcriptional regulator [Roseovarius sp. CAU 1744]|uniref:LysR family transcriptional regulator n=1 Tax=Roseovarius sp. CAU 1744 TaxID=3140368 RepID=UPI00325BD509
MRHLQTLKYIDAIAKAGSIRSAAEVLSITSTALNRRILALEEELGVPIFERFAQGVRLSAAGEIFITHARSQIQDMERVKSQISDLSGARRGHVSIACSQALLPYFLPEQITEYREVHPGVNFSVFLHDRSAAEDAIINMLADIAIVFEPIRTAEIHTIHAIPQQIHAVLSADHPLAERELLRIRECMLYPMSLPSRGYGVRHLIERAVADASFSLEPVVVSNSFEFLRHHAVAEGILSFQIPIGLLEDGETPGVVKRPIDPRDVPIGFVHISQLKGRALPVAVARFVEQIVKVLEERYPAYQGA